METERRPRLPGWLTGGLAVLLVLGGLLFVSQSEAHAAGHRECGSYSTYLPIGDGGVVKVVKNITSRNVSCADARAFVRKLWRQGMPGRSRWIRLPGWHRYWGRYREYGPRLHSHRAYADLRATRGRRVIRFQYWTDYC